MYQVSSGAASKQRHVQTRHWAPFCSAKERRGALFDPSLWQRRWTRGLQQKNAVVSTLPEPGHSGKLGPLPPCTLHSLRFLREHTHTHFVRETMNQQPTNPVWMARGTAGDESQAEVSEHPVRPHTHTHTHTHTHALGTAKTRAKAQEKRLEITPPELQSSPRRLPVFWSHTHTHTHTHRHTHTHTNTNTHTHTHRHTHTQTQTHTHTHMDTQGHRLTTFSLIPPPLHTTLRNIRNVPTPSSLLWDLP